MSNLFSLVKINLSNVFDISKIVHSSSKNERSKSIKNFLIVCLIFLMLAGYVFYFTYASMEGFIKLEIPYYVLGVFFSICSGFVFLNSVLRVKNTFFDFKDYDLLMSLPISRNMVIASKVISLYFINLLYTFIFMIPSIIGFSFFITESFIFYLVYFFMLLVIPIIPMVVAFIVGTIITYISSFFKKKNIAHYLFSVLLALVMLIISFKMDNMDTNYYATIGKQVIEKVNSFYPMIQIFLNILEEFEWISFIVYMIIPILIMSIFVLVLDMNYLKIRNRLIKENIKDNYKVRIYKSNPPFFSLYRKELKRYFSSVTYVLNTMFGPILLILSLIMIMIFNFDKIEALLKIEGLKDIISMYSPFIISIICALSSTTYASISLEGKSNWIMKMIPVSAKEIYGSKMLVSLTIAVPTIFIATILLSIIMHFDVISIIFLIIIPLLYSVFMAQFGLMVNVYNHDFNWTNEVKIIKQSVNVLFVIMTGFILAVVPMVINVSMDRNIYFGIISTILLVINIILGLIISTKTSRDFVKI